MSLDRPRMLVPAIAAFAIVLAGAFEAMAQQAGAASREGAPSLEKKVPFNPLASLARLRWARYEYTPTAEEAGETPSPVRRSWIDQVTPTRTTATASTDGLFSWLVIDGTGQKEEVVRGPIGDSSLAISELASALSWSSIYAEGPVPIVFERESVTPTLVLWNGTFRQGFLIEVDASRWYAKGNGQRWHLRVSITPDCPAGVVEFEEIGHILQHGQVRYRTCDRWLLRELSER